MLGRRRHADGERETARLIDTGGREEMPAHRRQQALSHRLGGRRGLIEQQNELVIEQCNGVGAPQNAAHQQRDLSQQRRSADVTQLRSGALKTVHLRGTDDDTVPRGERIRLRRQLLGRELPCEIVCRGERADQDGLRGPLPPVRGKACAATVPRTLGRHAHSTQGAP